MKILTYFEHFRACIPKENNNSNKKKKRKEKKHLLFYQNQCVYVSKAKEADFQKEIFFILFFFAESTVDMKNNEFSIWTYFLCSLRQFTTGLETHIPRSSNALTDKGL